MLHSLPLLAQDGGGIAALIPLVFVFAVLIFVIAGVWKTFEKAGKPGWMSLIPILNVIVMLEIAGKPVWWFLLLLIPLVNLIVSIIVMIDFAKAFGKGAGFGLGLAFLGFIFFPILGFGDAQYQGAPA